MDKRKAWREQERRLVEKWNAAAQALPGPSSRRSRREEPFTAAEGPERGHHDEGCGGVRAEIETFAQESGAPEGRIQLRKTMYKRSRLVRRPFRGMDQGQDRGARRPRGAPVAR